MTENLIQELKDRQVRAFNVIIYGVDELNSPYIEQRITYDKNTVSEMINKVAITDIGTVDIRRISRLGKPGSGSLKPIKLEMTSSEMALLLIKHRRLFHEKNGIRINNDKMKLERDYYKKLPQYLVTF